MPILHREQDIAYRANSYENGPIFVISVMGDNTLNTYVILSGAKNP